MRSTAPESPVLKEPHPPHYTSSMWKGITVRLSGRGSTSVLGLRQIVLTGLDEPGFQFPEVFLQPRYPLHSFLECWQHQSAFRFATEETFHRLPKLGCAAELLGLLSDPSPAPRSTQDRANRRDLALPHPKTSVRTARNFPHSARNEIRGMDVSIGSRATMGLVTIESATQQCSDRWKQAIDWAVIQSQLSARSHNWRLGGIVPQCT